MPRTFRPRSGSRHCRYDLDVDEEHDGRAYFDLSAVPELVYEDDSR